MEIKKLFSKNGYLYMKDDKSKEVNLTHFKEISDYERDNKLELKDILINYFNSIDSKTTNILKEINDMAIEYNIDHYMYGSFNDNGLCTIDYNIKNRLSLIDCKIRIFYEEDKPLKLMIFFEKGSSGFTPGFTYYLGFNNVSFEYIKTKIEQYFKGNESKETELQILNFLNNAIESDINNYYSNY